MATNTTVKNETRGNGAGPEATQNVLFTPRVDILENETELTLFADVAGVKPEDADVRFENGELILHCRCAPRRSEEGAVAVEYAVGDYYRTFTISADIDAQRISADLKNGVLTVHLPKVAAVQPRRIKVAAT